MNPLSSLRFRIAALVVLMTAAFTLILLGHGRYLAVETALGYQRVTASYEAEAIASTLVADHPGSLQAADYVGAHHPIGMGTRVVVAEVPLTLLHGEAGDQYAATSPAEAARVVDTAQTGPIAPCADVRMPAAAKEGPTSLSHLRSVCEEPGTLTTTVYQAIDPHHVVIRTETHDSSYLSWANTSLRPMWWYAAGGVALCGLGAWFVAGFVQRPVTRASLATRAIAHGDLSLRLPPGRDAFGRLSGDVNDMVDSLQGKIIALQESEARQRQLVADVAHELRTPATALLACADALEDPVTRDEAASLAAPQIRRLSTLVREVLEMSALESGSVDLRPDRANLVSLVLDALHGSDLDAETDVLLSSTGDTTLQVDPPRVRACVRNLVNNAVRHGAMPVQVDIVGGPDDVRISITDSGAGVPEQLRQTVFDRFVRGDATRSTVGSGLGLAIARENARLHGGDLTLSPDGRTFELRLPRILACSKEACDQALPADPAQAPGQL